MVHALTGDWRTAAACRAADPEIFFASDGERPVERAVREATAKRICEACPVVKECLAWALEVRERNGVWGGTTEDERRLMVRRVRSVARVPAVAGRAASHGLRPARDRVAASSTVGSVQE